MSLALSSLLGLPSERRKKRDRLSGRPPSRHKDTRFRTDLGVILHGLGEGQGSVSWQSDVLPEQFEHPRNLSNEQLLCLAVLMDAIACVRRGQLDSRGYQQRECSEARAWIASRHDRYTFDFEAICQVLNLDSDYLRAGILTERRAT